MPSWGVQLSPQFSCNLYGDEGHEGLKNIHRYCLEGMNSDDTSSNHQGLKHPQI